MAKLSMNLVTLRKDPLDKRLIAIGEAGFEGVGLWLSEVEDFLAQNDLKDLKEILQFYSLKVAEICAVGGWHGVEDKSEARRMIERIGAICRDLGAERPVVICPVAWEAEVPLEDSVKDYQEICKAGEKWGLVMGLEFLGMTKGINNPVPAWQIVERASCPNGGVVIDVFHLLKGGGKPQDILSLPGKGVALVHFNDIPSSPPLAEQTDAHRLLPGEGVAPLKEVIDALNQIGYDGWFSIEVFNPAYWEKSPLEVCKVALKKAKDLLS